MSNSYEEERFWHYIQQGYSYVQAMAKARTDTLEKESAK